MTWAPVYETAANLRTFMRMDAVTADATDIAQDTLVHTPALTVASRLIDKSTGRQFGVTTSEARYYTAKYDKRRLKYVIDVDDLQATPTIAVDAAGALTYTTAVTDFRVLPANATARGVPVTRIEFGSTATTSTAVDAFKVTATWGWTAVPQTIKTATLLQASRIAKRRDAPFGVAGSPDLGNEMRLLAKLDPDVEVMVSAYRRYW